MTLLQAVEKEYLADGEIDARLGWMISGEPSPLLRCPIPYEKYRWSQSVSNIARKLNADALIFITEGFVRSDTEPYERTGQLTLIGQLIDSNGSVAQSVSGIYVVVHNRLRVVRPLQETKKQRQQNLFPPWA